LGNLKLGQFSQLARLGLQYVPIFVPLGTDLQTLKSKLEYYNSQLNKSQEAVPVLFIMHETDKFMGLIGWLLDSSKIIAIHFAYRKDDVTIKANLNSIKKSQLTRDIDSEIPIIMGLCVRKSIQSESGVSGAFFCERYGIDVYSHYVYSPEQAFVIAKDGISPEDYLLYSRKEGGYNKSENQIAWEEKNFTRVTLGNVTTEEGLAGHEVINWSNFINETEDLKLLNNAILSKETEKLIESKSRWHVVFMELAEAKNH
jgi:hypothetical protein